MFQEADDALFRTILGNRSHVLYTYLSERPSERTRKHNKFFIPKPAISEIDILSLDPPIKTYTGAILQIKLICRYICHHSILLYLYVYELCTQLRLTTVLKE